MKTLHTSYYLKTFRPRKDGTAPLVVRVTINGQRAEIPTGVGLLPSRWDEVKQRAKGSSAESTRANATINAYQSKIVSLFNQDLTNGDPSSQRIKDALTGSKEKKSGVLLRFQEHNDQFQKRVDADDAAQGTSTKYKTVRRHFSKFLNGSDIDITKVDGVMLNDFHHFLITEQGIAHNTTVRYVRALQKVLKIAHRKGEIVRDPSVQYTQKIKKKDPVVLNQDELDRIMKAEITNDSLDRIRDFFVFSCYTGLAYIDIHNLDLNDIGELNGKKWIFKKRKKTDVTSKIPLLKPAQEIIIKYDKLRRKVDGNRVFPVPSNQKVNEYLKVIKAIAKISKKLTFHSARHTFATTVCLANDVDLKSVSTMLGHSSIKQTEHYARMINKKLSSDMDRLDSVLIEKSIASQKGQDNA